MNNIISQHWTTDQDKLEAFVLGRIGKKENALLSAHLEKCTECSDRVRQEREILIGIRRFGRMEMKRRLQSRLKRDRVRRFEWIHVASLAAAIVIIFGIVFSVRSLFDFKQEKTVMREIVLSENKLSENREEKPAERSLWILGRVVEIQEEVPYEGEKKSEKLDQSYADAVTETVSRMDEDKTDISRAKAAAEEPKDEVSKEVNKSAPESIAFMKAPAEVPAPSQSISESGPVIQSEKKAKAILSRQSDSETKSEPEQKNDISLDKTGSLKPTRPEVKLGLSAGGAVKGADNKRSAGILDSVKTVPATAPHVSFADGRRDDRYRSGIGRSSIPMKRGKAVNNVVVRRGDMKDLPASMRTADPSVIQTKLERTGQNVLLTFYSAAIKDTAASYVEAVTQDSIIVTFRSRQISYRIPGGIGQTDAVR